MQAHCHSVARTQSEEDRGIAAAVAASSAAPVPAAAPIHTMPVTPSDEGRQLAAAIAASQHSHAAEQAERAASRARTAADIERFLPRRIVQLVRLHWDSTGEPMPAAVLKQVYDAAFEEELPLGPGQSVKNLLNRIAELEVFSPPGKCHILVRLREQPTPRRRPAATKRQQQRPVAATSGWVAPMPAFSAGSGVVAATAHVFVDYSNLWWGSGAKDEGKILSLGTLAGLLLRGRALGEYSLVAGSKPAPEHPLWSEWERLGYEVSLEPVNREETHPRAGGGGESQVDDKLHAAILQELIRRREKPAGSQTLVLVTGDGKDNGGRSNFPDCCRAALDKGWRVELWGWNNGIAGSLKRLADESGGRMTVNSLDQHRARLVVAGGWPLLGTSRSPPRHSPPCAGSNRRTPPRALSAGAGWGPCKFGAGCTRPGCKFGHAATSTSGGSGPADGQRMSGQFRTDGGWKPCRVVSSLPILGLGGHVLVQFDGYPDTLPIPTARLRAL